MENIEGSEDNLRDHISNPCHSSSFESFVGPAIWFYMEYELKNYYEYLKLKICPDKKLYFII